MNEADMRYLLGNLASTYIDYSKMFRTSEKVKFPEIKKVIYNPPATIVMWTDDTKTVVKATNELYDPEKGLAMAITKKALGNKGNYYNVFKKWPESQPTTIKRVGDSIAKGIEDGFKRTAEAMRDISYKYKECAEIVSLRSKMREVYDGLFEVYTKKGATKADLTLAIENTINYLAEVVDDKHM